MEPDKELATSSKEVRVCKDESLRKNIPVICNATRTDEGSAKKPHGIHLNPKFFKTANEQRKPVRYGSNAGPPQQHRFHEPEMSQGPPQRFDTFMGPRFNDGPPQFRMDSFVQRGPSPYQYRPPQDQRWRPPFPGGAFPRYGPPCPPNRFPFPNSCEWQESERFHHYAQNDIGQGHPCPPPLQPRFFPPNHSDFGANQFHEYSNSGFQPPMDMWQPRNEPSPGPSYYESYRESHDDYEYEDRTRKAWNTERKRRYESRSRSRSIESRRTRSRSMSASSSSLESRRRRSRSMSSGSHRKDRRSSVSDNEKESIWDSNEERNSDSDLDLSKPLDSLTSSVADSKALLRGALKCLGPSKVQTMIPRELSQLGRRKLFGMCRKLLDEIDAGKLVKVMQGTLNAGDDADDDKRCSEKSTHSQISNSSQSDTEGDAVQRKTEKKKKSKKKRKKRKKKKSRDVNSETESGEESQGSTDEEDNDAGNENNKSVALDEANAVKSDTSGTAAQQSLLELIQIEYKTKAINVMLKNLGVANEISSLVSNVLHTNGIGAVQDLLTSQEMTKPSQETEIACSSSNYTRASTTPDTTIPQPTTSTDEETEPNSFNCESERKSQPNDKDIMASSSDNNEDETDAKIDAVMGKDTKCDTKTNKALTGATNVLLLEDEEMMKDLDEDVLDLEVGPCDELDFI